MVEFHNLQVTSKFKYLWLKYVTAVNLDVHCARCLVGEYSKAIKADIPNPQFLALNEHPANIFYLCGVASPYRWQNNFHLAFRAAEGETFQVNELGISVTVKNAERIPITGEAIAVVNHPKKHLADFNTCRNWQFANQLYLRR